MKDKIFTFIIGLLIGAIITASVFLVIDKNKESNNSEVQGTFSQEGMPGRPGEMNGEEPPQRPDGEEGEEPPAKPDGDEDREPPTKSNQTNNQKTEKTSNSSTENE